MLLGISRTGGLSRVDEDLLLTMLAERPEEPLVVQDGLGLKGIGPGDQDGVGVVPVLVGSTEVIDARVTIAGSLGVLCGAVVPG